MMCHFRTFVPLVLLWSSFAMAGEELKIVQASGSCAIEGYTATDAKQLALQQARKNAIETANGFYTQGYTVVNNGALAVDLINTYTSGFIVREETRWSSQFYDHDSNASTAEIPEYKVTLTAHVKKINKKNDFFLSADLNKQVFTHGEEAQVSLLSGVDSQIAVFYYGNDDKIYKILPSDSDTTLRLNSSEVYLWPEPDNDRKLVTEVAHHQQETSEALIVLAVPSDVKNFDFSRRFPKNVYEFTDFFRTYSEIAHLCVERILPYRVFAKKKNL